MATDLAEFLRGRLDEDEHYLHVMIEVGKRKADAATPQDEADAYGFAISILSDPEAAKILEQWCDSAALPPNHNDRLLGGIAAKRKILDEYERALHASGAEPGSQWFSGYLSGLLLLLQIEAGQWSDHPGYRPEWKP